jgi:peptidoglycan/LPS O-acetylase OafA/YrhL
MVPCCRATRAATGGFRPDIEGLRGIAVLMVVAYHCGLPGFSRGLVGVDVFFVLSGYLITGLLAAEAARTGKINLLQFYARRVRRLLPAAAVVLLVTVVAAVFVAAPAEMIGAALRAPPRSTSATSTSASTSPTTSPRVS